MAADDSSDGAKTPPEGPKGFQTCAYDQSVGKVHTPVELASQQGSNRAVSTQPWRRADVRQHQAERSCFDHPCRHLLTNKKTLQPQPILYHRSLLPAGSKANAFAASNVTRILWPTDILGSELPCETKVAETPLRVWA